MFAASSHISSLQSNFIAYFRCSTVKLLQEKINNAGLRIEQPSLPCGMEEEKFNLNQIIYCFTFILRVRVAGKMGKSSYRSTAICFWFWVGFFFFMPENLHLMAERKRIHGIFPLPYTRSLFTSWYGNLFSSKALRIHSKWYRA